MFALETPDRKVQYRAEPALLGAAVEIVGKSGYPIDRPADRTYTGQSRKSQRKTVKASLAKALATNEGWLVLATEARRIAKALSESPKNGGREKPKEAGPKGEAADQAAGGAPPAAAPAPAAPPAAPDTEEALARFAAFCEKAAQKGGFYVY